MNMRNWIWILTTLWSVATTGAGFETRALKVAGSGAAGFDRVEPATTGIHFTNTLSEAALIRNHILENGSGVALGDYDGDGRCDLYLCRLEGPNALYRNLGDWRFEERTTEAGVGCDGQFSTGAAFADVDGDGDLDLLVNAIGAGTRLFLNQGGGRFAESGDAGFSRTAGSHSLALADVDGDGDLDVYVVNYRSTSFKGLTESTKVRLRNVNGRLTVPPEHTDQFLLAPTPEGDALVEIGEPDGLYLNDGTGRFRLESWTGGRFRDETGQVLSDPPRDWGLSAMFRDVNGDGAPDLYVCNDFFSPDRMWINDGTGQFRAVSRMALRKTSFASMAVDFADVNRDGRDDFLVVDMLSRRHRDRMVQRSNFELAPIPWWGWPPDRVGPGSRPQTFRNTLFLNRGDQTYAEAALALGVAATDWSWGCVFLDVDLDGWEDLLVVNGHGHDMTDSDALRAFAEQSRQKPAGGVLAQNPFPRLATANVAYRNGMGVGVEGFEEVSGEWGFEGVGVSNGLGEGDLDGDGDLDVVVNNLNGEAWVLKNRGSGDRVSVRLKGEGGNRAGIGSRITLSGVGLVEQSQEVICGGRYLSCGEAVRVFGTQGRKGLKLEVKWRSGRRSVVEGVEGGREYVVVEGEAEGRWSVDKPAGDERLFEEVKMGTGGMVVEEEYDDFARQPLLGRKLSQEGSGVGWMDLNGDGVEDLVVGSGRGGVLQVLGGNGRGGFVEVRAEALGAKVEDDLGGVVGWSGEDGSSRLLVGVGNYETGGKGGVKEYEVFFGEVREGRGIAGWGSSVGALALGDMDGDGKLELFVGGRVVGGKYPEGADSRVYRQEGREWVEDAKNSRVLKGIGMVGGAVWSDLDGDGRAELVVGCEWGEVKVYGNRDGVLEERTAAWGLSGEVGLWTGVAAGDVDGDGRMDLVVGNWGLNTVYGDGRGWALWSGDADGNGVWEVVEGKWDEGMKKEVPRRDYRTMSQGLPWVGMKYGSYREYGEAGVKELLGEGVGRMKRVELKRVESMVYLNRGGRFEGQALPWEAQVSPVYGVGVADVDGDGREDVYVSQNFFGVDRETGRMDGGRGVWLRGVGGGKLEAMSGERSGVKVYGEGRGVALGDYDGDGRVDLAVVERGVGVRVYRNRGGKVGLRVRLEGPEGNRSGLGAVVRLGTKEEGGAAREVHGGSGWWSQDSAVSVLGWPEGSGPCVVRVRWPGGRQDEYPVPRGSREIQLHHDTHQLEVLK